MVKIRFIFVSFLFYMGAQRSELALKIFISTRNIFVFIHKHRFPRIGEGKKNAPRTRAQIGYGHDALTLCAWLKKVDFRAVRFKIRTKRVISLEKASAHRENGITHRALANTRKQGAKQRGKIGGNAGMQLGDEIHRGRAIFK